MCRRHPVVAILAVLGLACSREPTAPTDALTGQWGARAIEFVADGRDAALRTSCYSWFGSGTIRPALDGRFVFAMNASGWGAGGAATLVGKIDGDTLALAVRFLSLDSVDSAHYVLTRNTPVRFDGLCLLSD